MHSIAIFSYLSCFGTIFGSFMKGSPSIFISEENKNYYSYFTLLTKEFMDIAYIYRYYKKFQLKELCNSFQYLLFCQDKYAVRNNDFQRKSGSFFLTC